MKSQDKLPDEHHVVRYVPYGKLRKDDDDNIVGVLHTAFQLRDSETYLSTTYLEYFSGSRIEQTDSAVRAIRASNLKPSPKSGFAIGNVGAIKNVAANRNHKIRIVYEPEEDNIAHSAIRQYPKDDLELLEMLATETWAELILNASIKDEEAVASDSVET